MKTKRKEPELFPNTPEMRCRDSKGRFATPEMAYADRVSRENRFLRLEREKYKRAFFAAADMSSRWHRKYIELLNKIKELCK